MLGLLYKRSVGGVLSDRREMIHRGRCCGPFSRPWSVSFRLRASMAKTVRSERNRSDNRLSDFLEQRRIAYGSPNPTVWVRFKEPVCRAEECSAARHDIIDQNNLRRGQEVLLNRERLIVIDGCRPFRGNACGRLGYRLGSHQQSGRSPSEPEPDHRSCELVRDPEGALLPQSALGYGNEHCAGAKERRNGFERSGVVHDHASDRIPEWRWR